MEDQEAQRENQGSMASGEGEGLEDNGEGVNNNEHRSWMCHTCNKVFNSGKALGGHMRIHNLSKKHVHGGKQKQVTRKTNKWVVVSGNPTCSFCGKSFSSMKSLFGHLRSHPERVRRGIQPSNSIMNNGTSCSNSTSSSTLSDDSAVDLSQALRAWSVTAKRGRRSPCSSKSNSGLEDDGEIDPRMQDAVYELMLLASGNPKWEEDDHVVEEKPLIKMGYEEGLLKPGFGDSTDMKIKKRNGKKVAKKMKLTELEDGEEGSKLVRCRMCNSTFTGHQALEGHQCSLKNSKNIQVKDESESDVSATEEDHNQPKGTTMQGEETRTVLGDRAVEATRRHQHKIFNKISSTDQVFGDHKRSNWTSMAEAQSPQATSPVEYVQNSSKIFSFDLNQLPAMDVEDGVQSDLSIPANTMTSSSYDSSSKNSITNQ